MVEDKSENKSYSLTSRVSHSGIAMLVSNFDDAIEVKITLIITTKALFYMAYSTYQEWLFEKVCQLRDVEKLTFDAIAKRITSEGYKSARGFQFIAESAFSTYKKGTIRKQRLASKPSYFVMSVECR